MVARFDDYRNIVIITISNFHYVIIISRRSASNLINLGVTSMVLADFLPD